MLTAESKIRDIIPVIGFGTWEIGGDTCVESVKDALNIGYRHIDTAQVYNNEEEVGKGIKQSGTDREDIFLTTKIATNNLHIGRIKPSFEESLQKLQTGYVDLLLIHWPIQSMNLKACLQAMFELKEENKVRHVGVSNFGPELFERSLIYGHIANNQVKFNPYHTAFDTLEVAKKTDSTLTAYSPLGRGRASKDETFSEIGEGHNKTASQIILRWLIQLGNVSVIPKAASEKHRRENFEIFDFELSEEEMKRINDVTKTK